MTLGSIIFGSEEWENRKNPDNWKVVSIDGAMMAIYEGKSPVEEDALRELVNVCADLEIGHRWDVMYEPIVQAAIVMCRHGMSLNMIEETIKVVISTTIFQIDNDNKSLDE